jgi:hypothetical protein
MKGLQEISDRIDAEAFSYAFECELPRHRWWTVFAWDDPTGCGFKLGPITIARFEFAHCRPYVCVSVFGLMVWDPLMYAIKRGEF